MAVVVEMHNTGNSVARAEIIALVEHALFDRSGEWLVSIVGSRASDDWEMKVEGPKGFERRFTLWGARVITNPRPFGPFSGSFFPRAGDRPDFRLI